MLRLTLSFIFYFLLLSCGDKTDTQQTTTANSDSTRIANGRPISGWSAQIGAFSDKSAANLLRSRLLQSNFPTYLTTFKKADGALLYRVRVGPFASEKEAGDVIKKLHTLGYRDAFPIFEESGEMESAPDSVFVPTEKDSLQRKQLTSDGSASHPAWSPTGREIAFFDHSKRGIFTVGTGGGPVSRIVESTQQRRILPVFAWSPSGRRMAFGVDEVNKRWELVENLYVVNKDGSGLRKLLEQDRFSFKIQNLRWSPDGAHIAFEANYKIEEYDDELMKDVFILALNESEDERDSVRGLAKRIEPTRGRDVCWSIGWKTSQEFLFLSTYEKRQGNFTYAIWCYNVAEKERQVLIDGPAVKNCQQVELYSNHVIYSTSGQLLAVNLASKQTKTVVAVKYETNLSSNLSHFAVASDSRLLFSRNQNLGLAHLTGGPRDFLLLPIFTKDFTVSPTGARVCFVNDGNLYTIKLP